MRTNIDIDDRLLSAAMRASGGKTKRAVVEEGLRLLSRVKGYRAILELSGTVHWDGKPDTLHMKKARSGRKVAKSG